MKQQRYVEYLAIQQAYDIKQREFLPPFGAMFGLALSLHVVLLLIWSLMPDTRPVMVPLQALNVRLGGAEEGAKALAAAARKAEQKKPVPQKKTPPPAPTRPAMERKPTPAPVVTAHKAPPEVRRHVAAPPTVSPGLSPEVGRGVTQGNATTGRQEVERYTRLLSLQVQAQARGVRLTEEMKTIAQGRRLVVELLLVIGQDGRLQRYSLARSSGFAELDDAAIRAAYNAAPYPPPPAEYSGYGFKVAVFVD